MTKSITITLEEKNITENKVLFEEPIADEFSVAKLGKVYIPKVTIAEIGYKGNGKICVELSLDVKAGISVKMEEPKKTCVLFSELIADNYTPERIGKIYIPKTTLAELGWKPNANLSVKVSVAK